MKTLIVVLAICAAGLVACSGDSSPATPDTLAYGRVANDLSGAVQTHRAASALFATQADCIDERERYDGRLAPLLQRMQETSGEMDACMAAMGHPEAPTLEDTCDSMRSELTRHMTAACASANADVQIAEANTHADRMMRWARLEFDGSARLGGMMRDRGCRP